MSWMRHSKLSVLWSTRSQLDSAHRAASTCTAVVIPKFGGPDVLELRRDVKVPKLGPDDVLVKVVAAAVNPLDIRMREGYGRSVFGPLLPLVPGRDVSGTVVSAGAQVTSFKPGMAVFGALHPTAVFGTYSELTVLEEEQLAAKPSNLSHEEAAAIPFAALTAWRALNSSMALEKGQRVLVMGGGGAVGLAAIQLAREMGAEVACTCGRQSVQRVKEFGAVQAISYTDQDVVKEAKGGFDLVVDTIGRPETEDAGVQVLNPGGRYVTLHGETARLTDELGVVAGGVAAAVSLAEKKARYIFSHPKRIDYSWAVMRSDEDALQYIAKLAREGKLRLPVGKVLALADAAEAQRVADRKEVPGKVVLQAH